jgi:hypothetical protein
MATKAKLPEPKPWQVSKAAMYAPWLPPILLPAVLILMTYLTL